MTSERTQSLKKKRNWTWLASTILWIGTALFYITKAFLLTGTPEEVAQTDGQFVSFNFSGYAISLAVTLLIAIILTIVIKDKVRNTIWMANVVLGSILFKETGMYITFGLWALDEWVIHAIYNILKNKVIINKEIDLRD